MATNSLDKRLDGGRLDDGRRAMVVCVECGMWNASGRWAQASVSVPAWVEEGTGRGRVSGGGTRLGGGAPTTQWA